MSEDLEKAFLGDEKPYNEWVQRVMGVMLPALFWEHCCCLQPDQELIPRFSDTETIVGGDPDAVTLADKESDSLATFQDDDQKTVISVIATHNEEGKRFERRFFL